MKYSLLIAFLALNLPAGAQSIGLAPMSFRAWGTAPQTQILDVDYHRITAVAVWAGGNMYDEQGNRYGGAWLGAFYTPVQIGERWYVKGSAGLFHRRYPTPMGQRLHFRFRAGVKFGHLGLEYSHISNGFGISGRLNIGLDTISVRVWL